jgi:hypothetical protein
MRITVTLTVDVDPEEWMSAAGCERAEVREDVRKYIAGRAQEAAMIDETGASVELK